MPTPLIDPQTVRALAGGTELEVTSEEIHEGFATLTVEADTLLRGDPVAFTETGDVRRERVCVGDTCLSYDRESGAVIVGGTDDFTVEGSVFTPVMDFNGVRIVLEDAVEWPGVDTCGGWLEHSYFSVQHNFPSIEGRTTYSLGIGSRTAPPGDATWTGALTGFDLNPETGRDELVQGKAEIRFMFEVMEVDVTFSEIVNLTTRAPVPDIDWSGVPVSHDGFSRRQGSDRIEGRFYGPSHEEAGGVFERERIMGAFGTVLSTP